MGIRDEYFYAVLAGKLFWFKAIYIIVALEKRPIVYEKRPADFAHLLINAQFVK